MTKVMVVDDDPDVLLVLERVLGRRGYTVVGACGGKECLKMVKEDRPDIIFLDVMMPGMDGWEVCREIKDNPSTSSIPVSMLTVMKDEEDIKKSLSAGADQHMGKPINFKEVLNSVQDLLGLERPTAG
ncbi:MAG: response regulator [Candidatus Hydrothermarchaeaceae archaeon]